ncbi:DUF2125 domain-containing protein [Lichenicola sp.]|uniref:DUF2125 domain-containing protein n=1 Tax=Lichenicola sp. TaxID=2804529 RepID=UPI003B0081CE
MHPAERSRRSRRFRALVVATMLLSTLLVGLDTLMWFRLERVLDRRLAALAQDARASGWHFTARAGERGGWPLSATLILIRPTLAGADRLIPGGIGWSGERATLSLSLLPPHRTTIIAGGTQTLSVASGSPDAVALRFWAARLALHLPDDDDARGQAGTRQFSFDAEALHVAAPGSGPDDIAQLADANGRLDWPPTRTPDQAAASVPAGPDQPAVSLSLDLHDIALPARLRTPMRVLQQARLRLQLTGRRPELQMRLKDALDRWRGSGGQLRITEASLEWGGSSAALAGDAGLDADGALDGGFQLALTQPDPVLRQLEEAGLLRPGVSRSIAAVLGLIAASEPGPHIHLPLDLRHGLLSLGRIPLLQIGPRPGSATGTASVSTP